MVSGSFRAVYVVIVDDPVEYSCRQKIMHDQRETLFALAYLNGMYIQAHTRFKD